ncbi:hypothetical protein K440DRAFT_637442 [Wilcoxina mikolae CBS 423.85]|nr:hypothetical protein K440DRAFT_637442 [Wilcoxina mikolae CBS 423.85]
MDITGLLMEAITKHQNAMPLPNTPGALSFHGIDVTIFLHKYENMAVFTGSDIIKSSIITMFPYYCMQSPQVRERVMMKHGYTDRYWAVLKKELLDVFRYSDSRPDSLVYIPLEEGGHQSRWVTAKITAPEALAMFEFMTPKSPAATEMTQLTSPALTTLASNIPSASLTLASIVPTTTPAVPDSAAPRAPVVPPTVVTSLASTVSMASTPPARTDMARQVMYPDLLTDLEKGIVSINNRDELVLVTADGEIPLEPAHRDYFSSITNTATSTTIMSGSCKGCVSRERFPVSSFSSPFEGFSEETIEEDGFGSRSVGRGWECQRLSGQRKKENPLKKYYYTPDISELISADSGGNRLSHHNSSLALCAKHTYSLYQYPVM